MALLRIVTLLGLVALTFAIPINNDVFLLEPRTSLLPGGLKLDFTVSRRVSHSESARLGKRSGILGKRSGIYADLTNHYAFYTIELEFGSQHSSVNVDLDTGSSDLFIPAPLANCEHCKDYGTFDPSGSSTSQDQHQPFNIKYADNSTSEGEFYLDQVEISGVTVEGVIFAVINQTTTQSGVLGIASPYQEAMPLVTGYQYDNFPTKLVSNGLISKNYYSIYLNGPNATQGSIIFGGIDSTKYTGPLVTLQEPLIFEQGANLVSITTGNITLPVNYTVAFDSGSTFSALQEAERDAIASNFAGAYVNPAGYYAVDCDKVPTGNVTYSFSGIDIDVPLNSLVGPQFDAKGNEVEGCVLDIALSTATGLPPILGDNFLRYTYTVFYVDDFTIQLAQAAPA